MQVVTYVSSVGGGGVGVTGGGGGMDKTKMKEVYGVTTDDGGMGVRDDWGIAGVAIGAGIWGGNN